MAKKYTPVMRETFLPIDIVGMPPCHQKDKFVAVTVHEWQTNATEASRLKRDLADREMFVQQQKRTIESLERKLSEQKEQYEDRVRRLKSTCHSLVDQVAGSSRSIADNMWAQAERPFQFR